MTTACGARDYYPKMMKKKIEIPFAFSNWLIKGMTALHPNHRSRTRMINARRARYVASFAYQTRRADEKVQANDPL